jgi:hypothetical protein
VVVTFKNFVDREESKSRYACLKCQGVGVSVEPGRKKRP